MTITATAFAKRVGISLSMASRILNGKRRPSIEVAWIIGDIWNIDEWELKAAYGRGAESFSRLLRRRCLA